ncbi:MAG: hypothetical protein CM15mP75_3460 [Flammeovirgaceae bacterium]|nr:MAG: hypothetical protein CM15mP75_3460 [Flammeovirgaceae bacterium]
MCDTDDDGDGYLILKITSTYSTDQLDTDADGEGDVCDTDEMGGYLIPKKLSTHANPDQLDTDAGRRRRVRYGDDGDGVLDLKITVHLLLIQTS